MEIVINMSRSRSHRSNRKAWDTFRVWISAAVTDAADCLVLAADLPVYSTTYSRLPNVFPPSSVPASLEWTVPPQYARGAGELCPGHARDHEDGYRDGHDDRVSLEGDQDLD